jgi:hypothetical protein
MDVSNGSLPTVGGWPLLLLIATTSSILLVTALAVRVYHTSKSDRRGLVSSSIASFSRCPNPNCIRCRRYRQVQESAQKRLPWVIRQVQSEFGGTTIASSLDRISDSIRHPRQFCTRYQAPTVLMVRDLPSQEVVTDLHRPAMMETPLHRQGLFFVDALLDEIARVPMDLWKRNDTPTSSAGSWEVLSLLNQGNWDITLQDQCPILVQLVRELPNLMEDCLFGNVMVSKIYAGTCIEPHCGPTNVRHRLQYTLTVPPAPSNHNHAPSLRVGGGTTRLTWMDPGDYFIFDDSMVHSVEYQDNETSRSSSSSSLATASSLRLFRMVLIVDLWHPNLMPVERAFVRYMYPPFTTNESKLD